MNSTGNSSNTLLSQKTKDLSMSSLGQSVMNHNKDAKISAMKKKSTVGDYNQTFGNSLGSVLNSGSRDGRESISSSKPPASKASALLRSSISQRKDFVQEIEGRLKGLRYEKTTPTFKGSTTEEIKSFNFENELERLKRTLNDIKEQECRFMKLLTKKSPVKYNIKEQDLNQHFITPAKTVEQLYCESPDQGFPKPSQEEKDSQKGIEYDNVELEEFPHYGQSIEVKQKYEAEENIQLTDSKPSEAYYDESSTPKQCLSTSSLIERKHNLRKSSLKKRKNDNHDDSHYNESTAQKSETQKKVRFNDNSIKYKYDVDGIIDNAKYTVKQSEEFLGAPTSSSSNPKPKRKHKLNQGKVNTQRPKVRDTMISYKPVRKTLKKRSIDRSRASQGRGSKTRTRKASNESCNSSKIKPYTKEIPKNKLKEPTPIKNHKLEKKVNKYLQEDQDSAEMSPVEEVLNCEPAQLESPTEIINITSPLNFGCDESKAKWDYEHQNSNQGSSGKERGGGSCRRAFYDKAEGASLDRKTSRFNSIQERYNQTVRDQEESSPLRRKNLSRQFEKSDKKMILRLL